MLSTDALDVEDDRTAMARPGQMLVRRWKRS